MAELNSTYQVFCPVRHGNKCFFPAFREESNYNGGPPARGVVGWSYNGGVELCDNYGGHLANIYSQTHMNDVGNYIRSAEIDLMVFRLGMKFDPLNDKLSFRNGSDASDDLRWRPGYSRRGYLYPSYTTMILQVNNNGQFLYNNPPEWPYYNVLCEIETSEERATVGAASMAETTTIHDSTKPIRGFPVTTTIEESSRPTDDTTKPMTSRPSTMIITAGDPCPVRYEGRCFFAVFERKVNLSEGREICERFGANLANIYSQKHMDDVINYVRREFYIWVSEDIRLGMTFDPQAKKVYFRDGSEAPPGLRWYPGAPFDNDTSMVVGVRWLPSSQNQYLDNQPPESLYYILCETGVSEETDTGGAASVAETTIVHDTTEPIRAFPVTMTIEENSGPADDTTKSMTSQPIAMSITSGAPCPVRHRNKCFFPVIGDGVSYNDGMEICDSYGGHLANIYSQTHMNDVMNYIREHRWRAASNLMQFRLGMKFDTLNGKLNLRDGSNAAGDLQWWPAYPLRGESYSFFTTTILEVNKDRRNEYQFLFNVPPAWNLYDVLCEIDVSEETDKGGAAAVAETTTIYDTTEPIRGFPDTCPVRYEDRCFFAVFERKVNRSEGRKICERFGGNLANIYSQTHMDDVIRYIRRELDILYIVNIHLGMTFDPQTRKIYFRDGSEAPRGLRWYPASPYDFDTSMVLVVNNIPSSLSQYLDNEPPNWLLYILCETRERVQRTHFGKPTDHEATTPMLTATKSEQTASRSSEDTTSSMTSPRNAASTAITDFCPIRYESKCFVPIFGDFGNYTERNAICESYGGQLANIYSQTHMEDITNYIRKDRRGIQNDNGNPFYSVHLGMVFDPVDEKLRLRDGSDAPDDLKWRPSYPRGPFGEGYPQYTAVLLGISGDESDRSQYLFNIPPQSSLYDDVLCEI